MFRSNELGQYVPAKSVSIKPESQRDYVPEDQIKFLLPQSLGYMDTSTGMSYIKFDLEVSGPGYVRPDWAAGAHSLIRRFRIQDGTGSNTLEEIEGYNTIVATKNTYNANPSIHKNRGQFEGRSANNDPDNQLYYAGPGFDYSATGDINGKPPTPLSVEVTMALQSGILNSGKVFPVLATKGLRLSIDTENASTALAVPKGLKDCGSGNGGDAWLLETAVLGSTGGDATAKMEKAAIDTEFKVTIKEPSGPGEMDGLYKKLANPGENPCPLRPGDLLHIALADGSSVEKLGVYTGLSCDFGSSDFMELNFIPDRANGIALGTDYAAGSRVFWTWSDRENLAGSRSVVDDSNLPDQSSEGYDLKDTDNFKVTYSIKNLEYVVSQVSPPAAYNARMLSQINSGQGLSMDFSTYTLYRNNVFNSNGTSQFIIPARETRAYSVLSVPQPQANMGVYTAIEDRSFFGIVDGIDDYNYVVGGKLVPDRRVSLKRLSQVPAKSEALHLIEVEKGVSNCGVPVRDLRNQERHLLITRAFSKYGQVFNTASQDLQLRTNYSASTKAKMYMNYICHLRRMNISNNGVVIIV